MGFSGNGNVCSAASTDGLISDESGSYVSFELKIRKISHELQNTPGECRVKLVTSLKLQFIVFIPHLGHWETAQSSILCLTNLSYATVILCAETGSSEMEFMSIL